MKDTEIDPAQPYVTVKIRVPYSVPNLSNWSERRMKVNLSNWKKSQNWIELTYNRDLK